MNRKLLIVDDELEILQWLEELFRYDYGEELGIYTARSAREALEQLNRVRFDVVLTDIKMPGMDGITLFERIKENWPRCKTVFLTGYRNFDDLYRVMNHHDVQYILKTEGDGVILAAVRRAFEALDQEMEEARRRMAEDRHLEKARFWMRRDLMDQVFAGLAVENIQASMDAMGVELCAGERVQPYLLRVDNGSANVSAGEPALQMEYLIRSIRDNQPPTLRLYIHMLDRQYAAMLVQPQQDAPWDWSKTNVVAQGMLEYAQAAFRASRGMTFSAIVHPARVALGELPQAVPEPPAEWGTVAVVFALLLNEIRQSWLKRIAQTITYLPYFLSWVILSGIFVRFLSPGSAATSPGLMNTLLMRLGLVDEPIYFLGSNDTFRATMVVTDVWKNFGYKSIVYLAALTDIDPTLYEAAEVDGAGRWKQTIHITLPGIAPFIALMTSLSIGGILSAGFDQIFNMYNPAVYETGDIIDTLTYRLGLVNQQYSLSAAVGLMRSVVSCVLVLTSYKLADKYAGYRVW